MKKRLIYCLKCPFTDDVHYIGKSTSGMIRPSQHLTKSHSNKIQEWVKELKILGQKPNIEVLMYVSYNENIDDCEGYLIKKYLSKGAYLLNNNLVKPIHILPALEKKNNKSIGSIGLFIKKRRKESGFSQEKFAEYIGVSITVLRQLEQGIDKGFNTTQLNIILSAFGCELGVVKIKE